MKLIWLVIKGLVFIGIFNTIKVLYSYDAASTIMILKMMVKILAAAYVVKTLIEIITGEHWLNLFDKDFKY